MFSFFFAKEYGNWPTYPQLYVDGKLVGGLDVTKALIDEGEFWESVPIKYQRKTPIVATTATTPAPTSVASTPAPAPAPQPVLSTEELNAKLKVNKNEEKREIISILKFYI